MKAGEPKISPSKGEDYTSVTFYPDLTKFKMDSLDRDVVDLFTRRAYDIAAASHGVKVFLNGKRIPVGFSQIYLFCVTLLQVFLLYKRSVWKV